MRTLIDRIVHFENTDCTVAEFNAIFTSKLEGFSPSLIVEIGELADTETTRFLKVAKKIVKHNFRVPKGEENELNRD